MIAIAASVNQEKLTQGDLRRRSHLRALAAAGLRHRPEDRAVDQGPSAGARDSAGPSRHEFVEQRRQDLLRDCAGDHRSRRAATSRSTTRASRHLAGKSIEPLPEAERRRIAGRDHSLAARTDFGLQAIRRHGAGRREDAALRQQPRRPASGGAGHVVPGSLPAHQDQAAVCRLGSGDRRYRSAEDRRSPTAWSNIARITRPITTSASGPIRPRCAIRIRRWC